MRKIFLLILILLMATSVRAAHDHGVVMLSPDQIKIQVKGIVCSFCAYGAQKKLSKLNFLESNQFTDGVHVDIENQQITLAVDEGQSVDLSRVYQSIKSGGYEPETIFLHVHGIVQVGRDAMILHDPYTRLTFKLSNQNVDHNLHGKDVAVDLHFAAALIEQIKEGVAIEAFVDQIVEE